MVLLTSVRDPTRQGTIAGTIYVNKYRLLVGNKTLSFQSFRVYYETSYYDQ